MRSEMDSPVAGLLRRASAYAETRPWGLTAADVVDGRVAPALPRVPDAGPRRGPGARTIVPVAAVALSAALVVGLVVGLSRNPARHSPPPGPISVAGPPGPRSLLLTAESSGNGYQYSALQVRDPATGAVVRTVDVSWSGAPFAFTSFTATPGGTDAYVEGQEGFGGPIILSVPLSGRGPDRLVGSFAATEVQSVVLSPNGRYLAWGEFQKVVVENLATGVRTDTAIGPWTPTVLTWSPSGAQIALVAEYAGKGLQFPMTRLAVVTVATRTAATVQTGAERLGGSMGAAWRGHDLFVGSQECLFFEKCPDTRSDGPALVEIDLANGNVVRTFHGFGSVESLAIDPRTGDLAVTGELGRPNRTPVAEHYVRLLGGPSSQLVSNVDLPATVPVAWVSAMAVGREGTARITTVPDVVGDTESRAVNALQIAGLRVRLVALRVAESNPAAKSSTVLTEAPQAGSREAPGSVVTLGYAAEVKATVTARGRHGSIELQVAKQ